MLARLAQLTSVSPSAARLLDHRFLHPVVIAVALVGSALAGPASAGPASAGSAGGPTRPALILDAGHTARQGVPLIAPLGFDNGAHAITSIAFSIDLETARLAFDGGDADGDGIPDGVAVLGPLPQVVVIQYDADDVDGELDVLLANLSGASLAEGVILEMTLTPQEGGTLTEWIHFSETPAASFGNAQGEDVEGDTFVIGRQLFSDGFESGDSGAWSETVP